MNFITLVNSFTAIDHVIFILKIAQIFQDILSKNHRNKSISIFFTSQEFSEV